MSGDELTEYYREAEGDGGSAALAAAVSVVLLCHDSRGCGIDIAESATMHDFAPEPERRKRARVKAPRVLPDYRPGCNTRHHLRRPRHTA